MCQECVRQARSVCFVARAGPATTGIYMSESLTAPAGAPVDDVDSPTTSADDINSTDLSFADLDLPEDLLAAVTDLGFRSPTAIQAEAIPPLMAGRDVVGVAQTGTGKTAAFALPLLAHIEPEAEQVQALVLAPTRELAMQGAEAVESFAAHSRNVEVVAVYGGAPYGPQLRALENGAQVVVGTPGRIMDLMDRGALQLDGVRYFVLDEADEMLRMGFAEDVESIAGALPSERISALFSATMPPPIRRVAEQHLTDPVEVTISRPASTVATVHQTFAVVPQRHKIGALARVLAVSEADAALVFVRTRATAEDLAIELGARGVATAALSGDVAQRDRERLVARLRDGTLDVLVATDVAARGLDVDRIGLVVNFDVPRETDTYVHRIGRTGRAGRTGESLTFVTPKERARLRRIEKQTSSHMEQVELPTAAEVSKLRAYKLLDKARQRFANGRLGVYREVMEQFDEQESTSQEPFGRDDLILALLAIGVRDPGPAADEEPDSLTVREPDRGRGRERKERRSQPALENAVRYRVEVGHKDRVKPGAIVGAITGEGGISGSDLGHIDIFPTFSLVEIGVPLSPEARRRIAQARVSGRELRITEDTGPRHSDTRHGDDAGRSERREGGRDRGNRRREDRTGFRSGGGDQAGRGRTRFGDKDRRYERGGYSRGDRSRAGGSGRSARGSSYRDDRAGYGRRSSSAGRGYGKRSGGKRNNQRDY
ncbi:MAG: DEAD/DEAH box helicase [Actinomycetaceae bacterium]|nr:DEAD/DEAH box helicase [Actinomycetaceae bacterium]